MKRNEPIRHIMTTDPAVIHVGTKPSDARKQMADGGFHHLPVVSGSKLVGLLTSTDLLRVTYDYGQDARGNDAVLDDTRTIEELMTTDPEVLRPESTVRSAYEVLAQGTFHALPVVEGDDLIGIVTTTDLLRHTLEQF